MQKFDVVIVGGGASGLTCALMLKRINKNISVVIIDACERLGKKLAATGNGQGNVSNSNLAAENYHGGGAGLAYETIGGDYELPLKIFNCLFVEDEQGRVYPSGRQASALVDSLLHELKAYNVQFINPMRVTKMEAGFRLYLSDGRTISAKKVVLACGGRAQKQFGTDGSSYHLAQSFGHRLTNLCPSLVQLKTDTAHIKTLRGLRAECRVTAFSGDVVLGSACGDVIFTDYGVSGNAVFKISSLVSGLENVTLSLEFVPHISECQIVEDIIKKQKLGYARSELLSGTLHNQIGRAIIKRSGSSPQDIARNVKNFTLNVVGTLGFDYAQVTRGGIDCADIGKDMQSKLAEGLYLVGEYVDVDGDCGGYNLLWAFASGRRAAESIAVGL